MKQHKSRRYKTVIMLIASIIGIALIGMITFLIVLKSDTTPQKDNCTYWRGGYSCAEP